MPAIETLAQAHGEHEGLEVETDIDGLGGALDAEVESTVYRLVQEALTNVVKHAEATHVTVSRAHKLEGAVHAGASPTTAEASTRRLRPTGSGSLGMRERIELPAGRSPSTIRGPRDAAVSATSPGFRVLGRASFRPSTETRSAASRASTCAR